MTVILSQISNILTFFHRMVDPHNHGGNWSWILYFSWKNLDTVHSTVCLFSSCKGKTCSSAVLRVKLHSRYFLACSTWAISIFRFLSLLLNLDCWLSFRVGVYKVFLRANSSHKKPITGWALKNTL